MTSRPRRPDIPSGEEVPVVSAESFAPTEVTDKALTIPQMVDSGSADWPIEPVEPPPAQDREELSDSAAIPPDLIEATPPPGPPPEPNVGPDAVEITPPPGPVPDPLDITPTPEPVEVTLKVTASELSREIASPLATSSLAATPAPAAIEELSETLLVEQEDKLTQLRAQQDRWLRRTLSGNTVVMFTELVDSNTHHEKHGDLAGRQKLVSHNALLFPIIRTNSGTIVKTNGDGIMVCFNTADAALSTAEGMQNALEEHNRGCSHADEEIHIRVGLDAGPVVPEDGDIHGDAVDVAARVRAKAAADEVLVTSAVSSQASGGQLEPAGTIELKGETTEVARLVWRRNDPPLERESPRLVATRYRLGQPLGRGPLGVVYSAEDVRLRLPVAVKVLHEFVSQDPEFCHEILVRVQTMASLLHARIVRVIDCSAVWSEEPFYVTERIDGCDLGAWVVRNGCPPPWRAARLLAHVGETLEVGHRHGLVHGNLKPENILVRSDGLPSVCDFGLAFAQQLDANARGPLFPPSFQAPEQIMGEPVDQRADVYSLGAVMYTLLAGRPPFESAATLRAQRAVASGVHRRLHRVRPDLPHYLTEVVAKAMAHSPDERFATIAEVSEALRAFANSEGGSA